jgi:hypothetical protein
MKNLKKTRNSLLLFFVFLALTALICQPSPLWAGNLYQFFAQGKTEGPYQGALSFSLRYYDADGDNRFSLNELIPGTFTGVSLQMGVYYTTIEGVPINGLFSPLTDGPPFGSMPEYWQFTDGLFDIAMSPLYWTYSQNIIPNVKIEQWKFILDADTGSGNVTLMKDQHGFVTANGEWRYNYQGADVSGLFSNAPVIVTGSSISINGSGTATNPSAPIGYQKSPFNLVMKGKAYNGHVSGTFTINFIALGWPPSFSGSWEGTRTIGRGITATASLGGIPALLLND